MNTTVSHSSEASSSVIISKRVQVGVRLVLWALPVLLLGWLLNQYFVPSGRLSVRYRLGSSSPYFSNVASKEPYELFGELADEGSNGRFQYLTVDPLYFTVTLPRPFSHADVTLRYLNPDNQPVIKMGTLGEEGPYLKNVAVQESFLENLPEYWVRLTDGNLSLWQKDEKLKEVSDAHRESEVSRLQKERDATLRETKQQETEKLISRQAATAQRKRAEHEYQDSVRQIRLPEEQLSRPSVRYASVKDFLDNPPETNTVLQYEYDLARLYRILGYQPSETTTTLDYPIRGSHEIATYIGNNERLSFDFTVQSINRHKGREAIVVEVWRGGNKVHVEELNGYGDQMATGKPSEERTVHVEKAELPEGVYHLKFLAADDIFLKKIVTQQHLIMFYKSVYLTDNPEYQSILGSRENRPTDLFVDGSYVGATTAHEKGFQTLQVGRESMTLRTVQEEKTIDQLSGITSVRSPKNDVLLTSDGYFAFSKEQLFLPPPKIETISARTPLEKYHYILSDYPQAVQDGTWLTVTSSFESPHLPFDKNNSVQFLVNFPKLPENHRRMLLQEIRVDFRKQPMSVGTMFQKLRQKLSSFFHDADQ